MKVSTYIYQKQKITPVQCGYSKNHATKFLNNNKLSPLASDVVSFQSLKLFSLRKVGAPFYFYDSDAIKNAVYREVPVIRNNVFGLKEYKSLTEKSKEFLNDIIEKSYECPEWAGTSSLNESGEIIPQRSLKDDANLFIDISNKMRSVWDKEHQDGYNLIFLGASPSVFERIMAYQGHDVLSIPFSRPGADSSIDYKEFFSKFGLTKEFIDKSNKPSIIFDYFIAPLQDNNQTLGKLVKALNSAGIEAHPDKYRAMNMQLNKNLIADSFHRIFVDSVFNNSDTKVMEDYFLFNNHIKSYATSPLMDSAEHFKNADKIKDEYEWSLSAKLMNFALIDKLSTR